jgi:host factor-I protein
VPAAVKVCGIIQKSHLFQQLAALRANFRLHRRAGCHLMPVPELQTALRGAGGACPFQACEGQRATNVSRVKMRAKKWNTAMAAERAQNLQDTFLNHVRKAKIPLTIFLVNGVKLQGVVTWFDNFCVLLRRDGHSQLVYKHAISTIMPGHPIQLFEGSEEPFAVAEKA